MSLPLIFERFGDWIYIGDRRKVKVFRMNIKTEKKQCFDWNECRWTNTKASTKENGLQDGYELVRENDHEKVFWSITQVRPGEYRRLLYRVSKHVNPWGGLYVGYQDLTDTDKIIWVKVGEKKDKPWTYFGIDGNENKYRAIWKVAKENQNGKRAFCLSLIEVLIGDKWIKKQYLDSVLNIADKTEVPEA